MTEEDNAMNTEVDTGDNVGDNFGDNVGQVQWFNKQKGFGFIKNVNDPTSADVFFHFSDIKSVGYKILFPGEFVSMDIMQNDGKDICRNIRGVNGFPLLTDNEKYHFRVLPKRDNDVSQ
jgi:CspA family cold shock protein